MRKIILAVSFLTGLLVAPSAFSVYIDPPYPISKGGTGKTTAQTAIDNLIGAGTTGHYTRYSGTHWVDSAIQSGDVPTLNQSTTGTAAALTSTPSQCSGLQFATGIAANGNANCSTPSGSGGLAYTAETSNFSITANHMYQANSSSQLVGTLPPTCTPGDQFGLCGGATGGTGGWVIASGASSQVIYEGALVTATSTGSGQNLLFSVSNQDCVTLQCAVTNLVWEALSFVGTDTGKISSYSTTGSPSCVADGNFDVCTWTSSGTIIVNSGNAPIESLVVAGAGAGGGNRGGGGGAGGVLHTYPGLVYTPASGTLTITVGNGGTGNTNAAGNSGQNSVFDLNTAIGGGGGGSRTGGAQSPPFNGGSGGACADSTTGNPGTPGTGTSGQGNTGGTAAVGDSGGGGGCSAVGSNGVTGVKAGDGGPGCSFAINRSLSPIIYGGGGGGGDATDANGGIGGTGGGGNGNGTHNGTDGLGGGGGGSNDSGTGGNGGKGIVILRLDVR